MKNAVNVAIAACVGAVVGFALAHPLEKAAKSAVPAAAESAQKPQQRQDPMPDGLDVVWKVEAGDSSPTLGSPDAKVTIVEFSDFQCPYCARAYGTVKQVEKEFAGDIRIIFKQRPLTQMHPNAMGAAQAAVAAGKQGKFWEMHDKLFESTQKEGANGTAADRIETIAKGLGLDMARFERDRTSAETKKEIEADIAQADRLQINGTPFFYVNGTRIPGAYPFSTFRKLIEEAKKRADEALAKGSTPKSLYADLIKNGTLPEPPKPAEAGAKQDVELGAAPIEGPKSAPVTLVVFSDFQCPFCRQMEPVLAQVKQKYGNKVRIAWKNFPLTQIHPNAQAAAAAAMAAYEQGNDKFWKLHDKLFQTQNDWAHAQDPSAIFEGYAKEAGVNVERWRAAQKSDKVQKQIAKDMDQVTKLNLRAAPTTFVNGAPFVGAVPLADISNQIDAELARGKTAARTRAAD